MLDELLDEMRPQWHASALCLGDGPDHWTVKRGASRARSEALRSICRRCPAATDCLIEALGEPSAERDGGPMRCSVNGPKQWKIVRTLVAEVDPVTRADFEVVASMILDERIVAQLRRLNVKPPVAAVAARVGC